jgi:hypothetical protein
LLSNDGAPLHHAHSQVQRQEDTIQLAAFPCVMLFFKDVLHLAEAISGRAVLLLLNTKPAADMCGLLLLLPGRKGRCRRQVNCRPTRVT